MVPPAFAVVHDIVLRNCLGITITGETGSLTADRSSDFSPSESDIGEVDFAFDPTISHRPMALCILRVEQLLVFTLSD